MPRTGLLSWRAVAWAALAALALAGCGNRPVPRTNQAGPENRGHTETTEGAGGSGTGTAGAEVTLRDRKVVFGAGACRKESDGSFVVEARERPDHYLSLRIPGSGGPVAAGRSYTSFVLSVVDGANRFSAGSGSVQLDENLRGGKLSATDGKGATATGSFTCGGSAPGG